MPEDKRYLGDAVYARFDGFGIELTTEDGIRATNTIYMEPAIVLALEQFVQELKDAAESR